MPLIVDELNQRHFSRVEGVHLCLDAHILLLSAICYTGTLFTLTCIMVHFQKPHTDSQRWGWGMGFNPRVTQLPFRRQDSPLTGFEVKRLAFIFFLFSGTP